MTLTSLDVRCVSHQRQVRKIKFGMFELLATSTMSQYDACVLECDSSNLLELAVCDEHYSVVQERCHNL